jgi:Predicted membrane protein
MMDYVWLIGRVLLSLIFIASGIGHLRNLRHTSQIAAAAGMPAPVLMGALASLLALLGGLSFAAGYRVEIGAILILLFLLPVTFTLHAFWKYPDAMERANHQAHFMKNVALIGGALVVFFHGAGPLSLG